VLYYKHGIYNKHGGGVDMGIMWWGCGGMGTLAVGMDGWMDGWTDGRTDGRTDGPNELPCHYVH